MYDDLIDTVWNTGIRIGQVQDLLIHPEDMKQYIAEAQRIAPDYEFEMTDMTRMCDLPIKTCSDCQRGHVYFGIRFIDGDLVKQSTLGES